MSGKPTYRTIPGSNMIQELWTVRLRADLKNGDCGSWAVDAQNEDLLGHVIDRCPESGVAYTVPAYHVLEDAKTTFGLDLNLYTSAELTTEMEPPESRPIFLQLPGSITLKSPPTSSIRLSRLLMGW